MSYDLAVWEGAQPEDDVEAGAVYDRLSDKYLENDAFPPTDRILAYTRALAQRWAALPEGRHVAWESLVDEASGPMIYLTMPFRVSDPLSTEAARLAREHGLVCYDPQTEHLRSPEDDSDRPSDLEHLVMRVLTGEVGSEHLPRWAAEALAEGLDSPALRELAGLSHTEVREARELFLRAAKELTHSD